MLTGTVIIHDNPANVSDCAAKYKIMHDNVTIRVVSGFGTVTMCAPDILPKLSLVTNCSLISDPKSFM